MEFVLGQFSGKGPIKVWKCVPALKGAPIVVSLTLHLLKNVKNAFSRRFVCDALHFSLILLPWMLCFTCNLRANVARFSQLHSQYRCLHTFAVRLTLTLFAKEVKSYHQLEPWLCARPHWLICFSEKWNCSFSLFSTLPSIQNLYWTGRIINYFTLTVSWRVLLVLLWIYTSFGCI